MWCVLRDYHTCAMAGSASRFFLCSLRTWRCFRRSAIIFWPRGDRSADDAGDGANESSARSLEGVTGRRDFGFLEESTHGSVSVYIKAKEENGHMLAFSVVPMMFSLLPSSGFGPFIRAALIASRPAFQS
jgi:hypothetical protein